MQALGAITPFHGGIPGYHPGAPSLSPQQLYFGQGPNGLVPPQPTGYGFQQQLLPNIHPGVAPNFFMPYHPQRQAPPSQRRDPRRFGNLQQVHHNQVVIT